MDRLTTPRAKRLPSTGGGRPTPQRQAGPAAMLLALQRSAGNAAASRLVAAQATKQGNGPLVVQRFGKSTGKYKVGDGDQGEAPFTTQSVDPVATKDNDLRHVIKHPGHPDLTFTDDSTMAINQGKAEPKEFYAAQGVIDNANHDLTGVNSAVELAATSGNTVTPKGGAALQQVGPRIRVGAGPFADGDDATFATHICIEVAMKVMGRLSGYKTEAIFEGVGGKTSETFGVTGGPSSAVYKIADFVGQTGDVNAVGDVHGAMGGEKLDLAGPEYAERSRKGKLADREEALGVNKFVKPLVGEGFATYSTRPPEEKSGGHAWGYHYAGVVAHSADHNDTMTLENYNRAGDIEALKRKMYDGLLKKNRKLLEDKLDEAVKANELLRARNLRPVGKDGSAGDVSHALKELVVTLKENEGMARSDAEAEYDEAVDTEPSKKWFFHMYGSKKGQSFHEQAAKSGFFSDPMTLRVKPG